MSKQTKFPEPETTHYTASGYLIGYLWGGGEGGYPARKYKNENLDAMKAEIKKDFESGGLDSGMGFEGLKCAIMDIDEHKRMIIDNETFTAIKSLEPIELGKMSDKDFDFIQEHITFI